MEQYFEITKDSVYYKEQIKYEEDFRNEKAAVKEFMTTHGIVGSTYMLYKGYFWITDNIENRRKFAGQIRQETYRDYISFKKTSKIGRLFSNSGITRADKPFVPFFFSDCNGRSRTRLFSIEDKVYCSIEQIDCDERLRCPKGFIEMKASDFYKIIEDNG